MTKVRHPTASCREVSWLRALKSNKVPTNNSSFSCSNPVSIMLGRCDSLLALQYILLREPNHCSPHERHTAAAFPGSLSSFAVHALRTFSSCSCDSSKFHLVQLPDADENLPLPFFPSTCPEVGSFFCPLSKVLGSIRLEDRKYFSGPRAASRSRVIHLERWD